MTGDSLLLDTNAAIDLLNHTLDISNAIASGSSIFLPLIVLGELEHGARNSENVDKNLRGLERLLSSSTLLLPDRETAARYGDLRTSLRRKGRPIPTNDIWIAALALQHELPVLTRDSHFQDVDGLTIVGW